MSGIDELIPDSHTYKEKSQICPICQTDNIKMENKGIAYCDNENCMLIAFHPKSEEEI